MEKRLVVFADIQSKSSLLSSVGFFVCLFVFPPTTLFTVQNMSKINVQLASYLRKHGNIAPFPADGAY